MGTPFFYELHLPEVWWLEQQTETSDAMVNRLLDLFNPDIVRFHQRSRRPVLSNDTYYKNNLFDPSRHQMFGDLLGLGFLPALFEKEPETVVNGAPHWPSLNLEVDDITVLEVAALYQAPDIVAIAARINQAKVAGQLPWGWLNVTGLLQTAWYLRGDRFFSEVQKGGEPAEVVLQKSTEIVTSGFRLAKEWFGDEMDPRLIHSAQCFLPPSLSKKSLPRIAKHEGELHRVLTHDLGLPYRIHLCTVADGLTNQFLNELSPVVELEILEPHTVTVSPATLVELLESNFFAKGLSEITNRLAHCQKEGFPMVLYDMDYPINIEAITRFCEIAEEPNSGC